MSQRLSRQRLQRLHSATALQQTSFSCARVQSPLRSRLCSNPQRLSDPHTMRRQGSQAQQRMATLMVWCLSGEKQQPPLDSPAANKLLQRAALRHHLHLTMLQASPRTS